LHDGHYKASFQKIAKRDFIIKQGSTVSWSGDPLDGQINITAIYKAKTSATDLLSAELAGLPDSERNAYRKLLNYEVHLIMRGQLLKPELSFMLDMPPKDQLAFGGMVYSRINMINADENELNKQVFSLLILGRFLPAGSSTPSSAVNTVARNSVNQMLSDQFNALSGKYVKGAELNVNLQSNDDYTSSGTQQNTEVQVGLKKELFNSRVSIQVGGNINTDPSAAQPGGTSQQNITGDMVMEYKITEDGSYRFKAFRENQNEGMIDGLIYSTGIGIIYTRDYDKLSELFRPVKKKENEEDEPTQKDRSE
jgi:translocation and assembly module TamB